MITSKDNQKISQQTEAQVQMASLTYFHQVMSFSLARICFLQDLRHLLCVLTHPSISLSR